MGSRSGQYGKYLGVLVNYCIENQEEMKEEVYRERFLEEIGGFNPKNPKKELDEVEGIDVRVPSELAKLVKEGMHLMYQEKTSKRAKKNLIEVVEE